MPVQRKSNGRKMSARQRKRMIRKRKIMAIKAGLVLLCLFLVYGVIQLLFLNYVRKNTSDTILEGISIGAADVSGMSMKEALAALDAQTAGYGTGNLTLKLDESRMIQVTYQELGLQVEDEKALVQKAYDYGKTGSLFSRYRKIKAAKKETQMIPITYTVDEDDTDSIIDQGCTPLLTAPVNASITLVNGQPTVTEGKAGEVIDLKASMESIHKFLNDNWHGETGTVTLSDSEHAPEITAEDLSEIKDLLGTYTTFYSADGTAHAKNVEQGATNVGGSLIFPGEEFSTNDAIGPEDEEHGFAKAGSYENGTVVETMGGGVCQVSTTLYNAVLYAELEIIQRDAHSMTVAYVDPSRDAAIADDVKDLVFKNDLDDPVYIETVLADGYLTFNMYGKETRDSGRSVDFESEILATKDEEGERFVSTDKEIGSFVATAAYQGKDAQLWKIIYQDGVEVSRSVINNSHYEATPLTYGVGITSDDANATNIVLNAISSQNKETILAAINTALGY